VVKSIEENLVSFIVFWLTAAFTLFEDNRTLSRHDCATYCAAAW